MQNWDILTGEYPPQIGGVSDYSRLVACALAAKGDSVVVWTPPLGGSPPLDPGVFVRQLSDHFGKRGLAELAREIDLRPGGQTQLLVQYVPHAFGSRALNILFCHWLFRHRRKVRIVIMFHEVAFPWVRRGRIVRHNFLAAVNRLMALLLVQSSRRVCVSIPGWERTLRPWLGKRQVEWLPIPSTMPQTAEPILVNGLRQRLLASGSKKIVGHFGTFGSHIAGELRKIVPELLTASPEVMILLIGPGGQEFAADLRSKKPDIGGRLAATGKLSQDSVSEHLCVCDLLIQPYVDGISTRRTSAMAGLACGLPILTTQGFLTEPIWGDSQAVCLAGTSEEIPSRAIELLNDADRLARLRSAALQLYCECFHIDRTIAALRCEPASLAA